MFVIFKNAATRTALSLLQWKSGTSLFFVTLTVLKSTGRVYDRMLLCWNLSDVFLLIRLGLWIWVMRITKVK